MIRRLIGVVTAAAEVDDLAEQLLIVTRDDAPDGLDQADDDAGLAIALGGAGLTVRELTTLYAALGDEGRAKQIGRAHV